MGTPVRIVDVAHKMISLLNGKGKDTYVIFTGLRPGEKLTEELFSADERPLPTAHPMIRLAARSLNNGSRTLPRGFQANVRRLIALAERDAPGDEIIDLLRTCVPSYTPMGRGVETAAQAATSGLAPAVAGSDEWLNAEHMVETIRLSAEPVPTPSRLSMRGRV